MVVPVRCQPYANDDRDQGEISPNSISAGEAETVDCDREDWSCGADDLVYGNANHRSIAKVINKKRARAFFFKFDGVFPYSDKLETAILAVYRTENANNANKSLLLSLLGVKVPQVNKKPVPIHPAEACMAVNMNGDGSF